MHSLGFLVQSRVQLKLKHLERAWCRFDFAFSGPAGYHGDEDSCGDA